MVLQEYVQTVTAQTLMPGHIFRDDE
jgi:hypothetical protein